MRHISSLHNIKGSNAYIDLKDIVYVSSIFKEYKGNNRYGYYFNIKCKGIEAIKIVDADKTNLVEMKNGVLRNWKKFK